MTDRRGSKSSDARNISPVAESPVLGHFPHVQHQQQLQNPVDDADPAEESGMSTASPSIFDNEVSRNAFRIDD